MSPEFSFLTLIYKKLRLSFRERFEIRFRQVRVKAQQALRQKNCAW